MMSETEIVRDICDKLLSKGLFFWRSNNIPAPGRALPKYTPRGLPDLFVITNGYFIAVEVKRPIGDKLTDREANGRRVRAGLLSPDQAQFGNAFNFNGGIYVVVHSWNELFEQLKERSVPAFQSHATS